jgi:hypothetical protein
LRLSISNESAVAAPELEQIELSDFDHHHQAASKMTEQTKKRTMKWCRQYKLQRYPLGRGDIFGGGGLLYNPLEVNGWLVGGWFCIMGSTIICVLISDWLHPIHN